MPYFFQIGFGSEPVLRTSQFNSLWLSGPDFVASFETRRFVYFLFRETAIEAMNCGKAVYSRIARICKNDDGYDYLKVKNSRYIYPAHFHFKCDFVFKFKIFLTIFRIKEKTNGLPFWRLDSIARFRVTIHFILTKFNQHFT